MYAHNASTAQKATGCARAHVLSKAGGHAREFLLPACAHPRQAFGVLDLAQNGLRLCHLEAA